MCECLKRIPEGLLKKLKSEGLEVKLTPEIVQAGFSLTDGRQITCSDITYSIVKTAKNGNQKEVRRGTKIMHSYCPFCGAAYSDAVKKESHDK